MKTSPGRLLSIAVLLLCAAVAALTAVPMVTTFMGYRSPLQNTPPQPAAKLGQPVARRVVFVLIDGLRLDVSQRTDVMPNLAALRKQGASAIMHSQAPSYSQPGYSVLLTGAWPYVSDGPAFNLDTVDIPTFTQDNLFSAAHRGGLKTAISGYNWFEKLVPQADVDLHFYTPGEDAAADDEVMAAALPWLAQPQTVQLALIHIDQVDYAGHHLGGQFSPDGLQTVRRSDELLGQILAKLDLTRDTVLVVSDHGHLLTGGHGGADADVLIEPFVLAGAGVKPGAYPDVQMVDVAPTLAVLLGTNLPASSQGTPRTEMLNLPAELSARLPAAIQAQQQALYKAYTTAIGEQPSTQSSTDLAQVRLGKLAEERWPRLVLVAIVMIGLGWLVLRLDKDWQSRLLASAGYLIFSHLLFVLALGASYSFSGLTSALNMAYFPGLGLAALIVTWLALRFAGSLRNQGANLLPLTFRWLLTIVYLLALIPAAYIAMYGISATWTLPDVTWLYLTVMCLLHLAGAALAGVLVITFIRSKTSAA